MGFGALRSRGLGSLGLRAVSFGNLGSGPVLGFRSGFSGLIVASHKYQPLLHRVYPGCFYVLTRCQTLQAFSSGFRRMRRGRPLPACSSRGTKANDVSRGLLGNLGAPGTISTYS